MGEAMQGEIRLERGNAADAWGPRLARGDERFVSRIGFDRPRHVSAMAATPAERIIDDVCALPAREKAAFTLRLDPVRHARLKTACATSSRSAQQVVTQALDAFLAAAGGPVLQPRPAGAAIRTGGF